MTDINICIIGAGVVGLAIAAELSKEYTDVFVVEKNLKFGQETSSRNSEVIHSGIYYPTNSLKASLCVQGRKLLYEYCDLKGIAYNKCGKLIVANSTEEENQLHAILKQSQINGVDDGELISKSQIELLEPHINARTALYFPSTGIIDSHGLMKQLETDGAINGTQFAYGSEVVAIKKLVEEGKTFYQVDVEEQAGNYSFTTNVVINAAGLYADVIAEMVGIRDKKYQLHYWKGEYFGVGNGKNKMIKHLIYPVPNKNTTGLGVHATIDLNGGVKLGPNAVYMNDKVIDYSINKDNLNAFYKSAVKFLPFLEETDLHPDQTGIRPKLQMPGDAARDFIITEEKNNGFPNFINIIGLESPGLTASLGIARMIRGIIENSNVFRN